MQSRTFLEKFHDHRLRYLYEAVRGGTMRAASEKLNVAPSSISRQIAQLEEELGIPLIERSRRTLKLTEAGEIAINYYRQLTAHQEAFVSQLRDLRGLKGGTVHLAVGEGFIGDLLLDVLRGFMDRHPSIQLTMHTCGTNEVVALLLEDEAHIGMVFQAAPEAKIRVRASSDQPLKVILRPDHPLSEHRSLRIADLAGERLGVPDRSFRIRQILSGAESEDHVFLTPTLTSNSLLMLKEFARSGSGITILPSIAAHTEILAGTLAAVSIDHPLLMHTSASVITRLGRQLPVAAVKLLQEIEATMPFLPAP